MNDDKKQITAPLKNTDPAKPENRNPLDRIYEYEVNGEKFQSRHERLVAEDILKHAKEKDVIPKNPEDYILVSQNELAKNFTLNEWVDLDQDNNFVTVPNTSTPVA